MNGKLLIVPSIHNMRVSQVRKRMEVIYREAITNANTVKYKIKTSDLKKNSLKNKWILFGKIFAGHCIR